MISTIRVRDRAHHRELWLNASAGPRSIERGYRSLTASLPNPMNGPGSTRCVVIWLPATVRATDDIRETGVQAVLECCAEVDRASVPFVAAVGGRCSGAELRLALTCDVVVASQHATFSGGPADHHLGISGLLSQRVGRPTANRLLLAGGVLDAEDAVRAGLATSSCAVRDFVSAVDCEVGRILDITAPAGPSVRVHEPARVDCDDENS